MCVGASSSAGALEQCRTSYELVYGCLGVLEYLHGAEHPPNPICGGLVLLEQLHSINIQPHVCRSILVLLGHYNSVEHPMN